MWRETRSIRVLVSGRKITFRSVSEIRTALKGISVSEKDSLKRTHIFMKIFFLYSGSMQRYITIIKTIA